MSDPKPKHARDYLCNVCGDQAVVFVGKIGETEDIPLCKEHSIDWVIHILTLALGIKYVETIYPPETGKKTSGVEKGKKPIN